MTGKITFIAWVRFQQRSEFLAQHLGAAIYFIYHGQHRKLLQLPVRYLVQAWKTWCVLRRERPDVIFVQNPPIFCVIVAFLYARANGTQYVIDSHTGAFFPPWDRSVGLHRILSRRALTTIVHNKSQETIVKNWGCHTMVLSDYPGPRPVGDTFPLDGQFNFAVISSFAGDEPLDIVFDAAGHHPKAHFYVTGDSKLIAPALLAKKPDNCSLTGYLSYDRYLGLLRGVNVIIALTTQNHTLLSGAYEAVSLGIPLITSDWPILRDQFPIGTIHVSNTVDGIDGGMREAQASHDSLRLDMQKLRDRLRNEWEYKFHELQKLLLQRNKQSYSTPSLTLPP